MSKKTCGKEAVKEWNIIKLGDICHTTSGGTPNRSKKQYYQGDIPWVKSGELNDGYIFDSEEKLTEEGLKNSSAKLFDAGTLLIAMYGATAGRTAILRKPAATNQAICAIFQNESVNLEFIRFAFLYKRDFLLRLRHGGAQPNLNQMIINDFELSIPSLPEQKAIARVLTTIQEAIAGQEVLIAKLKELKKSMMQYLFTHGTRGEKTKMTEIGEMPERWGVVELGGTCEIVGSSITFKQAENKNGENEVHGIKVSDMNTIGNEKYIVCAKTNFKFSNIDRLVSPNALIFPKRGAAIATNKKRITTKCSLLDPNLIAVIPSDKFIADYLFYYFETFDLSTLTDKGTIPQLNKKDLLPIQLPTPSKEEQAEVVKVLNTTTNKVESTQEKLLAYQNLFKTLLHELMSGGRRVN